MLQLDLATSFSDQRCIQSHCPFEQSDEHLVRESRRVFNVRLSCERILFSIIRHFNRGAPKWKASTRCKVMVRLLARSRYIRKIRLAHEVLYPTAISPLESTACPYASMSQKSWVQVLLRKPFSWPEPSSSPAPCGGQCATCAKKKGQEIVAAGDPCFDLRRLYRIRYNSLATAGRGWASLLSLSWTPSIAPMNTAKKSSGPSRSCCRIASDGK